MKAAEAGDAAVNMRYASKVIIAPGYGLAVAQAQHKLYEFVKLLTDAGVEVKFAIHPVAGRMPGHMNVLLAEAGVPYDMIYDLEDINGEFKEADVAVVIGANDTVNPAARTNKSSPIYGMPILNVDQARQVYVIKRGQGKGYSGVENELFFADNTSMVYGDAQKVMVANDPGSEGAGRGALSAGDAQRRRSATSGCRPVLAFSAPQRSFCPHWQQPVPRAHLLASRPFPTPHQNALFRLTT